LSGNVEIRLTSDAMSYPSTLIRTSAMINRLEPNLTGKQKEMVKFRYKYRSKQEKETWWKRYNYELYEIFNEL